MSTRFGRLCYRDVAVRLSYFWRVAVEPIPVGTMLHIEQYPQEWRQYEPIQPKGFDWRGLFRRLWAPIAAIGAFLAKFGVVLLKFKFLFSMFVSAAVYVWIGGWWFGIGLVVLLFVHRSGPGAVARRLPRPAGARHLEDQPDPDHHPALLGV